MSLAIAVPAAIAAAIAYGGSTAVQHDAAQAKAAQANAAEQARSGQACLGQASADGLVSLLRDPRWLLSVGGDAIGLILQVVALSTGPVVLVQPLLVLAVAVALPVGWALGGPRPGRGDVLAAAAVIGALAVFFVIVGDPGSGDRLVPRTAALTAAVTLLGGGLVCLSVHGRAAPIRAVAFGATAGAGFGVVGVLLNATSAAVSGGGWAALRHPHGLVPLAAVIVVGSAAMVLTQVSFQIGALGASFPASEAAGPVVAVALGGFLLHENVPFTPWHALAYAILLAVMVAGTFRLALGPSVAHATPASSGS
jgi:drug/metabolite transporter (DMT)-like permease